MKKVKNPHDTICIFSGDSEIYRSCILYITMEFDYKFTINSKLR